MLHPDVVISPKAGEDDRLCGAEAVSEFLDRLAEASVFEATDEHYHPLDDARVAVAGRLRWMDARRTLRDEAALWALEFRDGLLYRSLAVRSLAEAEALLVGSRADADA